MKRIITLVLFLLPFVATAQVINEDFEIGGKVETLETSTGDMMSLKEGCTFSLRHEVFGNAGTITQLKIYDPFGDLVYNDVLYDKKAVYIPNKENPNKSGIIIVGELFGHIAVIPELGIVSIRTKVLD